MIRPETTRAQRRCSLVAFVVRAALLVSVVMPLGIVRVSANAQTYTPGLQP